MKPLYKVTFYNDICNSYQTTFFNSMYEAENFAKTVDTEKGVEKNE